MTFSYWPTVVVVEIINTTSCECLCFRSTGFRLKLLNEVDSNLKPQKTMWKNAVGGWNIGVFLEKMT